MKKIYSLCIAILTVSLFLVGNLSAKAQDYKWRASVQAGGLMAFGDDDYDMIDDFDNVLGSAFSVSVGRQFTPLLGARFKARMLKLYSRVNLECMEAGIVNHPELFLRDGFYGYHGYAGQIEGTINLMQVFMPHRWDDSFNINIIAGAGVNLFNGYDDHVKQWSHEAGVLNPVNYEVETGSRLLPCGVIGGDIDIKVHKNISINIEALCTFTADKMEGIKYEESYDAYVTISAGVTAHF